ncbi:DNA polymerase III subunit delta' [Candidatus Liberibacter americanus]|uniref:DNA polymerase III delta prime subunit n=1 Tax=Candidatus Liberibacter americanus str. Sao Paulo TaxID=1261131 RepID=U6B8J7_9HYPH|nr:DNA polymerase III subunit delta' [Candidatus Liberibacter americanus]AHA28062.1 DNA polymerase III delta prime subunit [Candidatus Liberibacter americanus str. Sao Paulo]EMS35968.1 DNA polymerase III subunit delta' [Candidatus Liberibacter americanus PW_SP]
MKLKTDEKLNPIYNRKLFGHEKIEEFLSHYYRSGKMHHALLFEGEKGIGKASLGFRYASHILQYPEFIDAPSKLFIPDLNSSILRQMASHALRDFLYLSYPLDTKTGKLRTSITVDEIRRIKDLLSLTSNTGNWRIVMIDPVDAMNHNAANALLKSLEEPPKKVLFILISNVSGMILPTIRSRCLSVKFNTLSENNLCKALFSLDFSYSKKQFDMIKDSANGSVAKAVKILNYDCDKIISSYNDLIVMDEKYSIDHKIQKIADELSTNDKVLVFDFLIEFILYQIYKNAKAAALSGMLEEADNIVEIYYSIKKRLSSFFTYNLDRKQTIIYILEKTMECYSIYCREFYAK